MLVQQNIRCVLRLCDQRVKNQYSQQTESDKFAKFWSWRRVEDGGQQSAKDGVVQAGELPARPRPAPGRSPLPDGFQQSAEDDVVEARELPRVKLKSFPCKEIERMVRKGL